MLGVARVASLSDRVRVVSYGLKSVTLSDGIEMPMGMGRSQGEISCQVFLPGVTESEVLGSLMFGDPTSDTSAAALVSDFVC